MLKFDGLTDRQNEVLTTILIYMARRQNKPTITSLGKMLRITSTNGVMSHIKPLTRKGYLEPIEERSSEFFQIGPRVPKNMVVNVGGSVCILNPKWRMTKEEAAELADKLANFTFAGSIDIAGTKAVLVDSEGTEPPDERKAARTSQPPPALPTFVPPPAESPVSEPPSYRHPLSGLLSEC